jgi:glycosyltransferase involved in cell wall biosynthesis
MKRPQLFVKLAQALPEEQFVMVMPGQEKAGKELMMEANRTANLKFIESIPFHKTQAYFNRAKCFVNTSDFEGFPNTFIQACMGSTPILSFNVNPDNFINKYELGCFCRNNLQVAINFINGLDEDKISFYGNNALRYASENHNISDKIKEFERLIDSLV